MQGWRASPSPPSHCRSSQEVLESTGKKRLKPKVFHWLSTINSSWIHLRRTDAQQKKYRHGLHNLWWAQLLVIYFLRLCVSASAVTAYDLGHSFKNYNVLEKIWKISIYYTSIFKLRRVFLLGCFVDMISIKRVTKWYTKFGEHQVLSRTPYLLDQKYKSGKQMQLIHFHTCCHIHIKQNVLAPTRLRKLPF